MIVKELLLYNAGVLTGVGTVLFFKFTYKTYFYSCLLGVAAHAMLRISMNTDQNGQYLRDDTSLYFNCGLIIAILVFFFFLLIFKFYKMRK